jgi:1-deoxy-D-xylulose-5-phosphate reductoisomerase
MKRVAVLGSTGFIGRSALDVIRRKPSEFKVVGLAAGTNAALAEEQAALFGVEHLALASDPGHAVTGRNLLVGPDAPSRLVASTDPDIVINGISGAAGFLPSVEAVKKGAVLALANKESLVIGGAFIADMLEDSASSIIPVDSEHSAIFQCLTGEARENVARIILTASGGPFRNRPKDTFKDITPAEALNHPTWSMGRRITIDSATMMNKGLEIIEAYWLFGVGLDRIEVVVHPQSIVHSLVEFRDKSTKAQLSVPDMRLAIAYALSHPGRMELDLAPLDLPGAGALEFFAPDEEKFPALTLARDAMKEPRILPCIMNAADEVAIEGFLNGRIPFDRIVTVTAKTMDKLGGSKVDSPAELIELDTKSRMCAEKLLS